MSDTKPFRWTKPSGIADDQEMCEWNKMLLWANPYGEWRVVANRHRRVVVVGCDTRQAKGADLADAKRRAQASAMVYHELQGR